MNEVLDFKSNALDVNVLRQDFPILNQKINNHSLIYFDNAATTQKPNQVICAIQDYYQKNNANIHRGVHTLSVRATDDYENTRELIKKFVNAPHSHEIIFVRGATEAINLVAQSFGHSHLQSGDEIILSGMEHHSNIVPWQMLCERIGTKLQVIPVLDTGELDLDSYVKLFNTRTKLVAINHVSNAIGTINPVEWMIDIAHQNNVPVLVDGAQAVPHLNVDVQKLDCDFYAFSGHKMYGPTGIGVLYGKTKWLENMPPYQCGGDMITEVSFTKTSYNKLPHKFEAGTPNIAGVIGLGAAIQYLNDIGMTNIEKHEQDLLCYATQHLSQIAGLKLIGTASHKASVISFTLDDIHPHDIGTVLDYEGIAIRAGHHCAMPLMTRFNIPATARISFGLYNHRTEIDLLLDAIAKLKRLFA